MKKPNNITISLPQRYLAQLDALTEGEETIGQCAKRLLISLLEGSQQGLGNDRVSELQTRLERIEQQLTANVTSNVNSLDMANIEARLDKLEKNDLFDWTVQKFQILEDRMAETLERLERLEETDNKSIAPSDRR